MTAAPARSDVEDRAEISALLASYRSRTSFAAITVAERAAHTIVAGQGAPYERSVRVRDAMWQTLLRARLDRQTAVQLRRIGDLDAARVALEDARELEAHADVLRRVLLLFPHPPFFWERPAWL